MMKLLAALVGLATAGCVAVPDDVDPVPPLAAVLIRDRACAESPCAWLASEGAIVDIAGRPDLELLVHSDDHGLPEVATWTIVQDDRTIEVDAIDAEDNAAGSDITLVVPALAPGPITIQAQRGDAIETLGCLATEGEAAGYSSSYSSNCTCSYCSLWCSSRSGGVYYAGTCC